MLKQLRIHSRGNTHVWVDHPLLRGIVPAGGKITSGETYDVPEQHPLHEVETRAARREFLGCNLHVDFITDEPEKPSAAEEALQKQLAKMERSRDYYRDKRDKLREQLKTHEAEPEDGDDEDDPADEDE